MVDMVADATNTGVAPCDCEGKATRYEADGDVIVVAEICFACGTIVLVDEVRAVWH